jgi:hypothetical protein
MRVHVEIELADRKTAKFTPNHKKVSITWNIIESGMFIRLVSARNPGNIEIVLLALLLGIDLPDAIDDHGDLRWIGKFNIVPYRIGWDRSG